MILFRDTSARVKLYIKEDASDAMLALARSASAIAVCRIAWAEIMADCRAARAKTRAMPSKKPPRCWG